MLHMTVERVTCGVDSTAIPCRVFGIEITGSDEPFSALGQIV